MIINKVYLTNVIRADVIKSRTRETETRTSVKEPV